MFTATPRQYRAILDEPSLSSTDLSSLRLAVIATADPVGELGRELSTALGCPVIVRFSSTEAPLATGTRIGDTAATIATTLGRTNAGVELRLVDELGTDLTGRGTRLCWPSLPSQPRHDAWILGRSATHRRMLIDEDGWLHTNALGWIGSDCNLRADRANNARRTSVAATTFIPKRSSAALAHIASWRHSESSGCRSEIASARSVCSSQFRRRARH